MWYRRPPSEPEQQLALAAEVGDEQLQEGVDDESLALAWTCQSAPHTDPSLHQ